MGQWHPTITAHEVHASRRESYNDKGPSITVLLQLDTDNANQFVDDLILNRYTCPITTVSSYACLRASSAEIVPTRERYDTDIGEEILNPAAYKLVTVTYTSDVRVGVYIFDQSVLLTETITPQVEFLTLDYNKFKWSDGENLRSTDEAPGLMFRTYKINMIIERIDLTLSNAMQTLFDMNSTVNKNQVQFYTFDEIFEPETVLAQVESVERYIEEECREYTGTGSAIDNSGFWWKVNLSFSCHVPMGPNDLDNAPTWNKFYRAYYDLGAGTGTTGDDTDKSGWFEIHHKRKPGGSGTVVFKAYPVTEDMEIILRNP